MSTSGALGEAAKEYPQIAATALDLTDEGAIDRWFDDALGDLGGIDVLVNNAGTKGPTGYVEELKLDDWRNCLSVCLDAQFLCARRAAPVMKSQRSGSIINISSTAGLYGYGLRTPYAAAKWAVIGFTKSLAVELGPFDVRANAICPGIVEGARMDRVIEAEAESRGISFDACSKGVYPGPVDQALREAGGDRRYVPLPRLVRGQDGHRPGNRRRRPHRDVPHRHLTLITALRASGMVESWKIARARRSDRSRSPTKTILGWTHSMRPAAASQPNH